MNTDGTDQGNKIARSAKIAKSPILKSQSLLPQMNADKRRSEKSDLVAA
jgi:hypothetical protein